MPFVRRLLMSLVVFALCAVPAVGQETTVYLVRHAEKVGGTDPDPSLSDAGRMRAVALAAVLKDAQVNAVLVTARKRTAETAAPLVDALHLSPVVVPFGANGAEHVALAAKAIGELKGKTVLVVGHSNTVPAIIAALTGIRMPDLCDAAYANLYVVRVPAAGAATLVRARYGADDHAEPASCPGMTVR
jgi:broad specificity phosphatase PhoE